MIEIIGVRFKKVGKIYYFDPCGQEYQDGQGVIVETARGLEYGEVVMSNCAVEEEKITVPLKKAVRPATSEDVKNLERNRQREQEAMEICQKRIEAHKLDMKLIGVEHAFDNSKILFYFTSDGRVDFRDLVKDLAFAFHTRIELRQIGVRDEAKLVGGLGICGRPFCCASFLEDFQPVSIKMAKEQNLSLNPVKISGSCGRLMCCLKYEQAAYEDLLRTTPRNGTPVQTPDGKGVVSEVQLLRQLVKVRLEKDPEGTPVTYQNEQLRRIRIAPKEEKGDSEKTDEEM